MGLKFKKTKIKIFTNSGRGEFTDGLMEQFVRDDYENIKQEFDGCTEEEKAELV